MKIASDLPSPIFPPRTGRIVLDGERVVFRFLGTEETGVRPIDWRPLRYQKGTRLWLLNLHYMEYLEDLDDQFLLEIMADWVEHTPPFQAGFWRDNWNSFSLSIRVVVWMQQLARRALTATVPRAILESLQTQLLFLERHLETDIGGNHLVKNIKALLWGGTFFSGPDAARMFATGEALLRRELPRQIHEDGMHFELTPAYHRQVFADFLEIRTVVRDETLRSELDAVLGRMADTLSRLVHPDGELAQFGDTAMDSDYTPEVLLKEWSAQGASSHHMQGPWELPDAGFAGFRSDGQYFIIRTGKIAAEELPAHAHGDVGSFEWSVNGRRMIVDAGVYEYDQGQRRRWARSTEAHNTVTVGGADQAEFWGSFRVGRRPMVEHSSKMSGESLEVTVTHDGFSWMQGRPIHRRKVKFSIDNLIVDDEVTAESGRHEVCARLLLHPALDVQVDGESLMLVGADVTLVLDTEATVRVRRVEWFPQFGEVRETTQLILSYGTSPVSGGFRLRVLR